MPPRSRKTRHDRPSPGAADLLGTLPGDLPVVTGEQHSRGQRAVWLRPTTSQPAQLLGQAAPFFRLAFKNVLDRLGHQLV